MLSVHQHWDPLKTCIIGRGHDENAVTHIHDVRVRQMLEKIARETEEDFQKLAALLESFSVTVLRPDFVNNGNKPPVAPRDHTAMIGNLFFIDSSTREQEYADIINHVQAQGNEIVHDLGINTACVMRLGKDLVCSELDMDEAIKLELAKKGLAENSHAEHGNIVELFKRNFNEKLRNQYRQNFQQHLPAHRCHYLTEEGHIDGYVLPLRPGILLAADFIRQEDMDLFAGWEIIKISRFQNLDPDWLRYAKTSGGQRWWVHGQDPSQHFIDYVESYLKHWVGHVSETFFQVNTLIIDQDNVVCINYPDHLLRRYEELGITPHAIDFRHRFFWDGGVHCITSDLDRQGQLRDDCLTSSTCLQARLNP